MLKLTSFYCHQSIIFFTANFRQQRPGKRRIKFNEQQIQAIMMEEGKSLNKNSDDLMADLSEEEDEDFEHQEDHHDKSGWFK